MIDDLERALTPSLRVSFSELLSSPRDFERVSMWLAAGFNSSKASRARPDLGCPATFARTAERYHGVALAILLSAMRSLRKDDDDQTPAPTTAPMRVKRWG